MVDEVPQEESSTRGERKGLRERLAESKGPSFSDLKDQMRDDMAKLRESQAKGKAQRNASRDRYAAAVSKTAGIDAAGSLLQVISRDEGRNAVVTVYPDRIERVKARSFGALSKAHQDVEVTPMRAVSSVQAKKAGMKTLVTVYATGNTLELRLPHADATRFRQVVMQQLTGASSSSSSSDAESDVADQIRKLAALRDEGILTEAEFAQKKAKLLDL